MDAWSANSEHADEVNYLFTNGSDVFSGFEIGNESDLYTHAHS